MDKLHFAVIICTNSFERDREKERSREEREINYVIVHNITSCATASYIVKRFYYL